MWDMGSGRSVIYSGVKLLSALYVSIAFLYLILFDTGSHPSSSNMKADGVA